MEKKRNHLSEYGYDSDLPLRLRALMENRNGISPLNRVVSQSELADAINITRQAVSTYCLGTSVPDAIRLKSIADYFQVSADYLLGISTTRSLDTDMQSACKTTGLSEDTIKAIMQISNTPKKFFAFSQLVQTKEFSEIVAIISEILSIHWKKKVNDEQLLAMDAMIREESGGSMRVVHASTEKYLLLSSAQNLLSDAIKLIDKKTAPPKDKSDGAIWRIEDE